MPKMSDDVREILRMAYQVEVDGYTFYSMVADQAKQPAVQELFDKLARDETEHKAYLKNVMRNYEEKGTEAFSFGKRDPQLKQFASTILTSKFKEEAKGADFEMGALSIGMQLEANAIKVFSSAARNADDQEVKDFYQFLADWEKEHLDSLQNLHTAVRQDFWSDGGFAPF